MGDLSPMVGVRPVAASLQTEILVLPNVLRRKSPKRAAFGNIDRLLYVRFHRLSPKVVDGLKIRKPETVPRVSGRRWKSRSRRGRPGSRGHSPAHLRDQH